MNIEDVKNLSEFERFKYWMEERHKVYFRREVLEEPRPWTDDLILQQNFFTNPYRENDKTTVWFRENIRKPLSHEPLQVLFATVCFRWFNYIPTGELLLAYTDLLGSVFVRWDIDKCKQRLRSQGKIFTGAFNISNGGSTKNKLDRVTEDYIQPIWNDRQKILESIQEAGTMQGCHKILTKYPGFGGKGFMAYEVVCDLRYTCILEDATDKESWVNMGPGAIRGLNRLLGRPFDRPLIPGWLQEMRYLLRDVQKDLRHMPHFEMREIEHSLCEYDKYCRVLFGQGRSKRMYKGV